MLKKVVIILAGLALGGTALQGQAFARDGGHGGGGFSGGHGGGMGGHGGGHGHFYGGGTFFDDGVWPYDGDYSTCYWTRRHHYVCN